MLIEAHVKRTGELRALRGPQWLVEVTRWVTVAAAVVAAVGGVVAAFSWSHLFVPFLWFSVMWVFAGAGALAGKREVWASCIWVGVPVSMALAVWAGVRFGDGETAQAWVATVVAAACVIGAGAAGAAMIVTRQLLPPDWRSPRVRRWSAVCASACYVTAVAWAAFGVATVLLAPLLVPAAGLWALVGARVARGGQGASGVAAVAGTVVAVGGVQMFVRSWQDEGAPGVLAVLVLWAILALHALVAVSALPQTFAERDPEAGASKA